MYHLIVRDGGGKTELLLEHILEGNFMQCMGAINDVNPTLVQSNKNVDFFFF